MAMPSKKKMRNTWVYWIADMYDVQFNYVVHTETKKKFWREMVYGKKGDCSFFIFFIKLDYATLQI